MSRENPRKIYIFSGKRKSGKDFFTDQLFSRLNPESAVIIKLSAPIKSTYAKSNDLDYDKLLDASVYKESHRLEMVAWSEKVRNEDNGYFCRAAIEMSKAGDKPIWIVSDARRKTDLKWFKENYRDKVSTFRIFADEESRKKRGWTFTEGIDDKETECGLDDVDEWTRVINNSGTLENLEPIFSEMVEDLMKSI